MAQYAALPFKISRTKDETHLSDNLFRVTQAQSNIPGHHSGNTGNQNIHGNNNRITKIVLPSVTHFDPHQGSTPGVGETGIIRIPERYLAKN